MKLFRNNLVHNKTFQSFKLVCIPTYYSRSTRVPIIVILFITELFW